jgi:hypothetical protein
VRLIRGQGIVVVAGRTIVGVPYEYMVDDLPLEPDRDSPPWNGRLRMLVAPWAVGQRAELQMQAGLVAEIEILTSAGDFTGIGEPPGFRGRPPRRPDPTVRLRMPDQGDRGATTR